MATNLINAKVTVPGTTASRTFGEHLGDIIDVRHFGAKGDGTTDDTAAIQSAVTYCCNNEKLLIFSAANSGQFYKITDQILIPYDTHHWAICGVAHRTKIKQMTSNKPFIHFDSLVHNTSGLTNGGFHIANFQVTWNSNQVIGNTHAAVVEFNDGGYADFVLENLENVNGCRCITHQYPGQTISRALNIWGCIFRHLYNAFSASGAAVYIRSNPTEGEPNILIQHVYSVQNAGGEELIHMAGATSVVIENVEQNFGNFTPGCTCWAGTGNIFINGWRIEQFDWFDGGIQNAYFVLNGSGAQISEYKIHNFEMRFGTINLSSDKFLVQTSGARVVFDGFMDAGVSWTAGNLNLFQGTTGDILEVGLSTIVNDKIKFCNTTDTNLHQIHFSGGSRAMEFYKNSLTTNMTAVINDASSNIKGQRVAESGWIWSLRLDVDATITAGSVQVLVYKNGTVLDSSAFQVTKTSGTTGTLFNSKLKNQNNTAYQVVAGDVIDVRTTTNGAMAGPSNLKATVVIANI